MVKDEFLLLVSLFFFKQKTAYEISACLVGSEQGGVRPVLIVQNDVGNKFSPTVIAAAITSQKDKANLPTHIAVNAQGSGLIKDSIILLEQVRTLDKHRLREKMGRLDAESMGRVDQALSISFGLRPT